MFKVKVKQSPAVIFTEDITLIDKSNSSVNQVQYRNIDIEFIDRVK